MKSLHPSVFSIIICTFLIHALINSINTKEMMRMRNEILIDQIQDYAVQISTLKSNKTYEEGVKEGFTNSKDLKYIQGYHQATMDQNPFTELITEN